MALTIAAVASKTNESVMPGLGIARVFTVTPDNSWLAVGEAADLTDYFSEIYYANIDGGSKVIHGFKMGAVIPSPGTDIAAGTVLITAHYSKGAAGEMTAVPDATDLSTLCAEMRLFVIGKPAD